MKVVVTDGKGHVELQEVACPKPDEYQCLCKIEACATCTGTDRKVANGLMKWGKYPGILGHESVGTVVELGRKVRHIAVGDRYLRPIAAYPGAQLGGLHPVLGGFAEYGLITDTKAMLEDDPTVKPNGMCQYQQKLPADLSISAPEATMLITLKEIASYLRTLGITPDSKVVILGTGAVSMCMCFFAKLYGANPVIVVGRRDAPILDCKKVGADFGVNTGNEAMLERVREYTQNTGADFVVDSTGAVDLILESGRLLVRGGTLAPYAGRVDSKPLVLDEIKGPGRWNFVQAGPSEALAHDYLLALTRIQAVPLKNFYSHVLPFEEFERGFQMVVDKTASKVVFVMK